MMIKRICSVILTLCLSLGAVGVLAYNDVDTPCQNTAVELVTSLGIIDPVSPTDFGSKTLVKRGEFALYATRLMGSESAISRTSEGYFKDVDTTTPEGAAVEFLASIGVIAKSGREYNPNDEITYAEAVRVTLNCLNYTETAKMNGGYPGGYIKTATDCGLNKNLQLLTNSVLTKTDTAMLIYNALFTNPMERDGRGYKKSDKTQIEKIWNVSEAVGIVTGYEKTVLVSGKILPENSVEINGVVYNAGTTNISKYIGCNVRVFYDDNETIVAFAEKANTNTIYTFSADDIEADGNKVSYYVNNRKKNLKVSESAAVIYNNRYFSSYTKLDEVLNIPEGEITFISNRSSGIIDVIMVSEYKHLLIERVDKKSGRLYLKNGSPEEKDGISLNDVISVLPDENDVTVYIDGKESNFDDLRENDAVTMEQSLDGEQIVLNVSRKTVDGEITGLSKDTIKISGEDYEKSSYSTSVYAAGTKGVFAITTNGKILGIVEKSASANNDYAYVLQSYSDNGPQKAYVKLYNTKGEVLTYECADNIKVNGKRIEYKEISNRVSKGEVITYTVNSDGMLSKINCPYDASSIVDYVNETEFIKNWNKSSVRYTDGIMGMSLVTDDTVIFSMPRFDRQDESDYKILNISDLKNRTYSDVTCYDVDRQGRVGALLIVEDISETVSMGNNLFFVKEVSSAVNDDDEIIWLVDGFENGEEKTLVFPEDTHSVTYENGWKNRVGNENFDTGCENFHAGDALQYSLNNNGEVGAYRLVYNNNLTIFDASDNLKDNLGESRFEDWSGTGSVTKQDFYDDLYISFGTVRARYMDYMLNLGLTESEVLGYGDGKSKIQIIDYYRPINLKNAPVYVYRAGKRELELGDIEDISKDDYVFVRSKKMGELNEVMVYSFD
ncbi:MAG: S-layer homology domain-containing protein [Clostridia bacterium]|nr:S-layer homology domain-containing protein [Clostridia bacterium]